MKILGFALIVGAIGYMFVATMQHKDETMRKCEEKLSHDACFQILNR